MKFEEDYVCLDTETTGFSPVYDQLIEICIIKVKSGMITDKFETLIDPCKHISSKITEITGIDDDMVSGKLIYEDVLPNVVSFIGNCSILGHNVSFDMRFINYGLTSMGLNPLSNRTIDTMEVSKCLNYGLPNHKLGTVAEHLGVCPPSHRAFNDVYATYSCYEIMKCQCNRWNVDYIRENLRLNKSKWTN